VRVAQVAGPPPWGNVAVVSSLQCVRQGSGTGPVVSRTIGFHRRRGGKSAGNTCCVPCWYRSFAAPLTEHRRKR